MKLLLTLAILATPSLTEHKSMTADEFYYEYKKHNWNGEIIDYEKLRNGAEKVVRVADEINIYRFIDGSL